MPAKTVNDSFYKGPMVEMFLEDEEITSFTDVPACTKRHWFLPQGLLFRKLKCRRQPQTVSMMPYTANEQEGRSWNPYSMNLDCTKFLKNNGDTLVGGERALCEIAPGACLNPKFILLDEPFCGIDPIAVEDIRYIISKIKN